MCASIPAAFSSTSRDPFVPDNGVAYSMESLSVFVMLFAGIIKLSGTATETQSERARMKAIYFL